LEWFRTLPMWLDLKELRVVHACWDEEAIEAIRQARGETGRVTTEFLLRACKKGNDLFGPVEIVLKGKEAALPNGISFRDVEGTERSEMRTRWYLPPGGQTYRTYALQSEEIPCDLPLEPSVIAQATPYPTTEPPVFVGHYWLSAPQPAILAENVACLDYSVARGGFLCAYRWHREQKLTDDHFFWLNTARCATWNDVKRELAKYIKKGDTVRVRNPFGGPADRALVHDVHQDGTLTVTDPDLDASRIISPSELLSEEDPDEEENPRPGYGQY
jgi:hypothetical protein